jgi:hypothetical protein
VFGRPDLATAGQLFVVAAGEHDAVEAAAPHLDAIGQKTFIISETPKAANLVKLSGNFLIAVPAIRDWEFRRPFRGLGSHIARRCRISAHLGDRVPAQSKEPRRSLPLFPSMKINRRTAA